MSYFMASNASFNYGLRAGLGFKNKLAAYILIVIIQYRDEEVRL